MHFPADRLESRTLDYVVYAGKDGLRVLRVPSSWRRLFARSFSSSAAYDATRAKFYWFEPPTATAFEIPGFEATSPRSLFQLCIPGLLPALCAFSARLWQRLRGRDGLGATLTCIMPRKSTPSTPRTGQEAQSGAGSASNTPRAERRAAANAARAARVGARGKAAKPTEAPEAPAARAGKADAEAARRGSGAADGDGQGGRPDGG